MVPPSPVQLQGNPLRRSTRPTILVGSLLVPYGYYPFWNAQHLYPDIAKLMSLEFKMNGLIGSDQRYNGYQDARGSYSPPPFLRPKPRMHEFTNLGRSPEQASACVEPTPFSAYLKRLV